MALRWRARRALGLRRAELAQHPVLTDPDPLPGPVDVSVPMADEVAGELDRLLKQSRWQSDDDLVFAAPHTGEPPYKPGILKRFRKALAAAQLDESHVFHDLRHTFGTRMAAAGVPMRTLQEWMGHRNLSTTQRCADYAPSSREAEMVAAAFARPNGSPECEDYTVGRFYAVEMTVPGDMSWCLETKAAFDDWMATLANPEEAQALGLMPALKILAGSGFGELVLSWVEVPAESAWDAIQEVVNIAESAFPDLFNVSAAMHLAVTVQDPAREWRWPPGA